MTLAIRHRSPGSLELIKISLLRSEVATESSAQASFWQGEDIDVPVKSLTLTLGAGLSTVRRRLNMYGRTRSNLMEMPMIRIQVSY